jgi:hypothetical protein
LTIPDFPHNIRIRLAQLNFLLFHPDVAKSLPCWLSQFRKARLRQPTGQRLSNIRTQQKIFSIGQILFLYYEESLVSSNFNSNLLRFHCAHPNEYTITRLCPYCISVSSKFRISVNFGQKGDFLIRTPIQHFHSCFLVFSYCVSNI